jgi:hypothetical protein
VRDQLGDVVERYHAAARASALGELAQMKNLFSHADDVVLANPFGPAVVGWDAASERLDFASARMHWLDRPRRCAGSWDSSARRGVAQIPVRCLLARLR